MKRSIIFRACAIIAALIISVAATAQNKTDNKIHPLPKDLEIQLALSSLPAHLRDNATVYTLNPAKGFEVAKKGTNGFYALVARTGDDAMRGTWPLKEYPDDILYPVSFDEAGAKANMQVFFDIAKMQASGTPADKVKKIIQERYKTKHYKAPQRAGLSYMMSPVLRTYTDPEVNDNVETTCNPHVMHYAPNVGNQDIGGVKPSLSPYPFIILQGPHGYTIQHFGEKERAAIVEEYKEMIARLCELNPKWCLPKSDGQNPAPTPHHR